MARAEKVQNKPWFHTVFTYNFNMTSQFSCNVTFNQTDLTNRSNVIDNSLMLNGKISFYIGLYYMTSWPVFFFPLLPPPRVERFPKHIFLSCFSSPQNWFLKSCKLGKSASTLTWLEGLAHSQLQCETDKTLVSFILKAFVCLLSTR